jgi:membrane protease subunit (stomatin/prohibitin family)
MTFKPFTRNYADHSSYEGFVFEFFCDLCGDGFKTTFVQSKTYKKGALLRGLQSVVGSVGGTAGWAAGSGAGAMAGKFDGMSPAWHKEHEAAFEKAQNEAKGYFKRCPRCKRYVCESDWNEQEGLCVDDAPREAVEVAAAKADKMVSDIREKAGKTTVFAGEIKTKQTICPECGKPAGTGKFCSNCGAPLDVLKCPKCGAESPIGTKFCGECGTKF